MRADRTSSSSDRDPQPARVVAPNLPKGGGSLRGIGEKFAVNAATGTGSFSIPITVSPGRSNFSPSLSLTYDSGLGNGPFGYGWGLSLPAITRKTDKGLPQYLDRDESDVFVLAGAEDLVPSLRVAEDGSWAGDGLGGYLVHEDVVGPWRIRRYRPRIEGLFARIERWSRVDDPTEVHWRSISPDNVLSIFGADNGSRIADARHPDRIFSWLISETRDDKGNGTIYRYKREDGAGVQLTDPFEGNRGEIGDSRRTTNRYIKSIHYGNLRPLLDENGARPPFLDGTIIDAEIANKEWMFEVQFDYGEHDAEVPTPADRATWISRPDPFSSHRAGFEIRTRRLCKRVLMFHHFPEEKEIGPDCLIASTDFDYDGELNPATATTPVYSFLRAVSQSGYRRSGGGYSRKRKPDIEFKYSVPTVQNRVEQVAAVSLENIPAGLSDRHVQWIDINGDGLPGVLSEVSGRWSFKPNISPLSRSANGQPDVVTFGPLEVLPLKPNSGHSEGAAFIDLSGDGLPDLVQLSGTNQGFFERDDVEGWTHFQPFIETTNRDLSGPAVRFIDLNGDGLADILLTEDDALVWHLSSGEKGFGPARRVPTEADEEGGPRVVFADSTETIFLADMNGDGLTDIVRIRNGEVSYWASEGYGRFSAKVSMGNAPHFDLSDAFDPRRIRLTDVDGSGTADLIYLGTGGIDIFYNQSGNGWSPPRRIDPRLSTDESAQIVPLDLFGNGTMCLVWSSPLPADSGLQVRYIDLVGGLKPHLLIAVTNNLGAETRISYAPSTRFYLQDKQAGKPWATRLPFPVQLVERVEHYDFISGTRFVSVMAYHHGYFDGQEREYRGFGMVEQTDAESFGDYVGDRTEGGEQDNTPRLQQPPVTTRSWFHTGAPDIDGRIRDCFRREFYEQTQHLSDAVLPQGRSAHELREAYRALKGVPLRAEVFSFDGTPRELHPYTVSENRFEVRQLQPLGAQRHAVFQPVALEQVSLNYERNPGDPRTAHNLILEIDDLGNAVKHCNVVYGRRIDDAALPPEVGADQKRSYVTYSETDYLPDIEVGAPTETYRLRAVAEARSYEVTGLPLAIGLYAIDDLRMSIANATPIDYEVVASGALPEKRLLSRSRSTFFDDDLNPLPYGQRGTLGLIHQRLQMAFTPAVIASQYGGEIKDADMVSAGYVHAGDADWWIPSGVPLYLPDAREHFYLPYGTKDQMGIETLVSLDRYDLLVERVELRQATWNVTSARNDYRMLGPVEMTDPNGNRTAVEIDELGMVTATAVMGKVIGEGDSLADPTTRIEYDLFEWVNKGRPAFVRTLSREKHGAANPRWQQSYTYFNGSGREVLTKSQVNRGQAWQVNPDGSASEVTVDVRWLGSGRTLVNNKGSLVKQYEPYFSTTHAYEDEASVREIGVTPELQYDPIGRSIRIDLPDGTFTRVDYAAWVTSSFDANDTSMDSQWYRDRGSPDPAGPEPPDPHSRAAWLAARHYNTPATVHFDSLGRSVLAVSDYGHGKTAATRSRSDLTGRFKELFDQMNRRIADGFTAMAGAAIVSSSAAKGTRRTFHDITGAVVLTWDDQGRRFQVIYDQLHRPISCVARGTDGHDRIISHVVYGDRLALAAARQDNLLGVAHLVFDQAGLLRMPGFDFESNPVAVDRILASDYKTAPDWTAVADETDVAAALASAASVLDVSEVFTASATYDALHRPTWIKLPDKTELMPLYNEANVLASLGARIRGQGSIVDFLKSQDYDAKGQRLYAQYGNSLFTRYSYDSKTFRLTDLLTCRVGANQATDALQALRYSYDAIGNITQIDDDAQQSHFFNNAVVRPKSLFQYDALYQLTVATGRELAGPGNDTQRTHSDLALSQLPHANNLDAVRTYTETYDYDLLGNVRSLEHRFKQQSGAGNGWTRNYRYLYEDVPGDRTNRLAATSLPGDVAGGPYGAQYSHDGYGNMVQMPHLAALEWNVLDQLSHVNLNGGGEAYYCYAGGGERMRKVIERPTGLDEDWIYLGAVTLHRRRRRSTGSVRLERWTVQIGDDTGVFAQSDTNTIDEDNADPLNPLNVALIRYRYSNHIGSVCLEVDDSGNPISYEEYHPYGTTAYRSARPGVDHSLKRYRFAGRERDDETGLYYSGTRYYSVWLGRWTSSDPAGIAAGTNLYRYCSNNPVGRVDPNGTDDQKYSVIWEYHPEKYTPSEQKTVGNKNSDPSDVLRIFEKHGYVGGGPLQWATDFGDSGGWVRNRGADTGGGEGGEGASISPAAPAGRGELAPPTPAATKPIPKLDFPQAPEGTNFKAAERSARAQYRRDAAAAGRPLAFGEQVSHPAKVRDGVRTNLHPSITNDQEFLHPVQSRVSQMKGPVEMDGRSFGTTHTAMDQGKYPQEAAKMQRRYGAFVEERVTHVWAGQNTRKWATGSSGPSFLRHYIVAPMLRGAAGHIALEATRNFVPFVAEAEMAVMAAGYGLYSLGYVSAGATVFGAAAYVPVAGGAGVAGAVVGNVAESLARDWGASDAGAGAIGMGAALGTGAAVGALMGSVIPVVGTGIGAIIGGLAGGLGYALSKWF